MNKHPCLSGCNVKLKKKKPEEKLINDGDSAPLSCFDLNIIKLLCWYWVKLHVNKGACVTACVKTPKTLKEARLYTSSSFMMPSCVLIISEKLRTERRSVCACTVMWVSVQTSPRVCACMHVCNCYRCSVRGECLTRLPLVTEALVQQETYAAFLS